MNIWSVTAVVSGQSRLGGTKIRIILDIALILHFDYCVKDRDLKKNDKVRIGARSLRVKFRWIKTFLTVTVIIMQCLKSINQF